MQSQASFNVFHVNHLNDISWNPFHFAVRLRDRNEPRKFDGKAPAVAARISYFPWKKYFSLNPLPLHSVGDEKEKKKGFFTEALGPK